MIKGYLDHSVFGRVTVTIDPRARSFKARWKGQQLHLTSPVVGNADEITAALDRMQEGIAAMRPPIHGLIPGSRLDFDGFYLSVVTGSKNKIIESQLTHDTGGKQGVRISIGSALDPADPEIEKILAKHVRHAARYFSPRLIEEARVISSRLGVAPAGWAIGTGIRRLGSCGADRRISLSYMCVYLPERLREYIVCHELAHLTHFDHSASFHALCSRYCGGDGDSRRAELKAFRWPVPR